AGTEATADMADMRTMAGTTMEAMATQLMPTQLTPTPTRKRQRLRRHRIQLAMVIPTAKGTATGTRKFAACSAAVGAARLGEMSEAVPPDAIEEPMTARAERARERRRPWSGGIVTPEQHQNFEQNFWSQASDEER